MTDSLPGRRPRPLKTLTHGDWGKNDGLAAGPEASSGGAAAAAPPDALSSLPIDILDNIFSRLHIYDVVRTSALSRAWRRRSETLPSVDLSHSAGISASDVDALFLRRGTAPVRAFRLPSRDPSWVACGYFDDWLLCLSRRGVRDLALGFLSRRGFIWLHSCLFSCRELTRLSLIRCRIPPAPAGHAGFPNLKTLRLERVFVAGGGGQGHAGREFASLIASSPVLEEAELLFLMLVGDGPDEEWMIRAPNLRKLSIIGPHAYGGQTENLPRLEEAVLFGENYAKFLTGMVGVTKLDFRCISIWPTEVDVLEKLLFLFENLRSLSITVNFCETSNIFSMFCLLRSAPVLEELDVWAWSDGTQEIEANNEFFNVQCADQFFAKLHVVHMKMFSYLANEMHFMEFVLSKARVLRVLYVTLEPDASCSNEEFVTGIAEYPRASPDAQIIFMGREPESSNDFFRGLMTTKIEDSDEGTQTDEARPRRRQRMNFESVAQVDQLEEEILKLVKERDQIAADCLGVTKEINVILEESRKFRKYSDSCMQLLCERFNINYGEICQPCIAPSSDCSGTSKPGGTRVDAVVNDAGSSPEDSPEDPCRP
ncbi:hypothetical protein EJB05_48786, partial [Eragrostis curvula]